MAEKSAEFLRAGRAGLPQGLTAAAAAAIALDGGTPAFGYASPQTTRTGRGDMGETRIGWLRWRVKARRHPSAFLLAAQLLSLVLYPLFDEHARPGACCSARSACVVLVLAVLGGQPQPGQDLDRLGAGGAGGAAVAAGGRCSTTTRCWSRPRALEALLYLYAAGSLIALHAGRPPRHHRRAVRRRRDVHAAGLGLRLRLLRLPGAGIRAASPARSNPERRGTWLELLFLSFTTLSATGLGDVAAAVVAGAGAGDAGAVRRRGLHRRGGVAPDRPDHPAPGIPLAPAAPRRRQKKRAEARMVEQRVL